MTRSISMPMVSPNPSQFLQAPKGLLKLNRFRLGSIKSILSSWNLFEKPVIFLESIS